MPKFIISILVTAGYLMVGQANAQCEGQVRNEHPRDGYTFVTTSRIYDSGTYQVHETCVENHSDRALDFNWYIPGPNSWIPANGHKNSPRHFCTRQRLEVTEGCLRYGNLWMPHQARFEPHRTDSHRLSEEDGDCSSQVERESSGNLSTSNIEACTTNVSNLDFATQVYGPADSDSPDRTLVKFRIEIRISTRSQSATYMHELSIYPEQVGEIFLPQSFSLVPNLRILRGAYSEIGFAGGILPANEPRSFFLELRVPETPYLWNVRFGMYNGNNNHVATVFVPFWLDG